MFRFRFTKVNSEIKTEYIHDLFLFLAPLRALFEVFDLGFP
jgi:hypothetical protein